MKRDFRVYLDDIVDSCTKIAQYINGKDQESFEEDTEVQADKTIMTKGYKSYFFIENQLLLTSKSNLAKKFGIHFVEEKIKKVKQLEGSIACKGLVKGYVRILMGHDQISLLKEGEILVSPMTIPDFLPAMKKAAAFVTDEGGMLCHAAIVAREMEKPCITGTKFATTILKDGDFVEVDALERNCNHSKTV